MPDNAPDGTYINCPNCDHTIDTEKGTTVSSEVRWKYIGTLLAGAVVLSLPTVIILAGLGIITLGPIGQGWAVLYGTVVLMAATWTWGEKTLKAVQKARGK